MNIPTKSFFTKVVGVTFPNTCGPSRQDILQDIQGQISAGQSPGIKLFRDSNNPFDNQAVSCNG